MKAYHFNICCFPGVSGLKFLKVTWYRQADIWNSLAITAEELNPAFTWHILKSLLHWIFLVEWFTMSDQEMEEVLTLFCDIWKGDSVVSFSSLGSLDAKPCKAAEQNLVSILFFFFPPGTCSLCDIDTICCN